MCLIILTTAKNFPKNLELVDKINDFAKKRGVTPAQLALAWIRAHSNSGPCGTIIPIPGATAASRVEELQGRSAGGGGERAAGCNFEVIQCRRRATGRRKEL